VGATVSAAFFGPGLDVLGSGPRAAETQAGGTIKVKLADKRAALMDLAKLMGYVVEKKDHQIRRLVDLSHEELEALLADGRAGIEPPDPTQH
jgi:hypothetical protein